MRCVLEIRCFNPYFVGCGSGRGYEIEEFGVSNSFNPYFVGCGSGSPFSTTLHTLNLAVSILILLDVVLEELSF